MSGNSKAMGRIEKAYKAHLLQQLICAKMGKWKGPKSEEMKCDGCAEMRIINFSCEHIKWLCKECLIEYNQKKAEV